MLYIHVYIYICIYKYLYIYIYYRELVHDWRHSFVLVQDYNTHALRVCKYPALLDHAVDLGKVGRAHGEAVGITEGLKELDEIRGADRATISFG